MTDPLLRPRSAMEIVDATFRLYRLHFSVLASIALILLGPFTILSTIVGGTAGTLIDRASGLLMPIVSGATVLVVANVLHGTEVSVRGTLAQLDGAWGSLILVAIIQNFLMIIGLIFLIVPGVIAVVWTFAAPMAVVVEGARDSSTAFGRARQLARGQFGHILGTMLLSGVAIMALLFSAVIAFGIIAGLAHIGETASGFVSSVLFILLFPIFAISSGLLYFDLRIRAEAYDIERLASALDSAPVTPSAQHDSTSGTLL